ncbi:hypothetical protein NQ318_019197 [Aromia moschata]|uniref:Late endosomal/lysosomal adaptor and MAPK and MTOR activator 4 n=1 Tax=Aromia moschata TaxID=1265417 RepID=A0AAV8YR77_9CUCU|nr:hypothetical protein NQ318_019197 [Aromia moschata]
MNKDNCPIPTSPLFALINKDSYGSANNGNIIGINSANDMDRPGQTGYLLLNEEGAVISSSGDLENDEKSAVIIMGLINLTSQIDSNAFPPEEGFKKLSIVYDDHCYIVCLSNRKIHIVKKTLTSDSTHSSSKYLLIPLARRNLRKAGDPEIVSKARRGGNPSQVSFKIHSNPS